MTNVNGCGCGGESTQGKGSEIDKDAIKEFIKKLIEAKKSEEGDSAPKSNESCQGDGGECAIDDDTDKDGDPKKGEGGRAMREFIEING